jgi:hypothetical protein
MDDLEMADAVAAVLAYERGDQAAVAALAAMHGPERLLPAVVGLLAGMLASSGVDVEATLADWQARRRAAL